MSEVAKRVLLPLSAAGSLLSLVMLRLLQGKSPDGSKFVPDHGEFPAKKVHSPSRWNSLDLPQEYLYGIRTQISCNTETDLLVLLLWDNSVLYKQNADCQFNPRKDIHQCSGPVEVLNELNSRGRSKISALRNHINKLEVFAQECVHPELRKSMNEEVKNNKDQLTSTLGAFRKANVICMLSIERANKEQLFGENDEEGMLRHRLKKDKAGLVKMSSNVTEQLLSISRQLADTTQQSSSTLDTLVSSSGNVTSTRQELGDTGNVITQSGKLLAKYGRREFTDKVILGFAFLFFLACVFYIVQKRLF